MEAQKKPLSEHTSTHSHTGSTHHTPTVWDIVVKSDLLNVLILAAVLIYLGNKYLPKILEQRKNQISKELELAKQARIKAENELNEIKQKTENLESEMNQIKQDAKKTAETIKKQMEDETETELEQLRQKVKREINTSYEETVYDIKRATSSMAIKLAEEALSKLSKDQKIQKQLVEDFLSDLEKPNNN